MTAPASAARRTNKRGVIVAAVLLALAAIASVGASAFIGERFAGRPEPPDLLLGVLPYVLAARYAADIAVFAAMVVLLAHYLRMKPRDIPAAISQFALLYLLRAGINVLTPLARPDGQELAAWVPHNGMFPSGHAANVLLCVLLIDPRSAPRLRLFVLALAVTEWAALLLSRGHYTIDIVGGVLLAYFVANEWKRGTLFDPLKRLVAE